MFRTPDKEQALRILNIQYSVFLGVIVAFSFYVDTTAIPTVFPVIDLGRRPEAIVFSVYFILDWFTANVVEDRKLPSPVHLLAKVAWIAVLGATVISLHGSGLWKFELLATYVLISGLHDFWFMMRLCRDSANPGLVFGLIIAGIRLVFGFAFLIPAIMGTIGRLDVARNWDDPNSASDVLIWLVLTYFFLKIIRLYYFTKVTVH